MNFNPETFELMTKFGLAMLGILLLIFVLAVLTPKMAKFVDEKVIKKGKKNTLQEKDNSPESEYKVHDIYEADIFPEDKLKEE